MRMVWTSASTQSHYRSDERRKIHIISQDLRDVCVCVWGGAWGALGLSPLS